MAQLIDVPGHGHVEFPDDMSDDDIASAIKRNIQPSTTPHEKSEPGLMDRIKAGATGINRGFYSDLLGIPVDTTANVLDLAKAGIGYGASKITGNAPPSWTEPYKRDVIPGSADWLAKQINAGSSALNMYSPLDNPNPKDAISRILHSGGRVGGASILPNPNAAMSSTQTALNVGRGILGGLSGGSIGEVAPEYAGVAGMLPQAAGALSIGATKGAIRGGEAGRKEMEQRIQDFKNAGVESPSAGMASGSGLVQGIENMLSLTPGSVGLYGRHKQDMLSGIQNKTNALRNKISSVYGPEETGSAIQSDLKNAFKNRVGNTYSTLNDKVEQAVGSNFYVPVENSINTSTKLSTPIKGAEATSTPLINSRIAEISGNLKKDAYGAPLFANNANAVRINNGSPKSDVLNTGNGKQWEEIKGPYGSPINVEVNTNTVPAIGSTSFNSAMPKVSLGITEKQTANSHVPLGIPFEALKKLRTDIGQEASSNAIIGTPEQAQFKKLYGAMSEDMKQGVNMADRVKSGVPIGPLLPSEHPGTNALNRSNQFYSNAMNRIDALNPIANRATPEGAYGAVSQSLNAGPTVYQRIRNAVTPETRQKIVSTVIDEMGGATPGQQGAAGDVWSPRTFLTNYNKIDPQARTELFKRLPGGEMHAKNLADIAKAADMISQGSKVWANPSGTAPALVARGSLGAIGLGLAGGAFYTPLIAPAVAAGGGLLAANQLSKRLLLNPSFVNWLAKAPDVKPQDAQAYTQRLIANANLAKNDQYKHDVSDYISLVENGNNGENESGNTTND